MSLNDDAWAKVMATHTPPFRITASELKRITGREPRLLAKQDFSASRPAAFGADLNILPLSRYEYIIGYFNTFASFPSIASPVRYLPFPPGIESLDPAHLSSEANALSAASLAGVFADFLGVKSLFSTISGRMSTGTFDIHFGQHTLTVDRAQMEIDASFEAPELFCLIEAKNSLSPDFNIRQLYYPYRRFAQEVSKPVVPVYAVFSNDIFHLYRFEFTDPDDPQSITCVDSARYTLIASDITPETLHQLLRTPPTPRAGVFPQANSFSRVINLCELLRDGPLTFDDIATHYGFTPRQSHYYAAAGRYLGLIADTDLQLTALGYRIMHADKNTRHRELLAILASLPVFHEVLALERVPTRAEIMDIMDGSGLNLSPSTITRRASTVAAWAQWAWEITHQQQLS